MKQLDPKVMATMMSIEQLIVERDEAEGGPPTYKCLLCLDLGHTLETTDQVVATRCQPCLAREKAEKATKDGYRPAAPEYL